MRRWVYAVLPLLIAVVQAAQLPLTVSEISLMLRTGYSSDSLMQELAQRRCIDSLDEAKEKALVKAGASEELIAALKSGGYSLSATQTAAVLQKMQIEAQHRSERADLSAKANARYQAEIVRQRTEKPVHSTNPVGPSSITIPDLLKDDLVQIHNGDVSHLDETALANKKLIAVYVSAEWCGPCRKFTPQLVNYYKRVAPDHPEFEIVFYSMDRSVYAMQKYMRDENMPWPAIDFAKLKDKEALKKNAGNGIPSLVLMDSSGNVISSIYEGSQYRGPQKVLTDLDEIFSGKPPQRVAAAR